MLSLDFLDGVQWISKGDLFLTDRIADCLRPWLTTLLEGRAIPIAHRALKINEKQNGDINLLTKSDNNAVDDRGLYKQGQHWVEKKDVVPACEGDGGGWHMWTPHLPP
uniref:Uncharacterized protein n=1 Tax=Podarcis muralis TaxID=64176 RepID=A0A670J0Q4_PODMU